MPYFTITQQWIDVNVMSRFGIARGHPKFHAGIDHNHDGVIDITDAAYFGRNLGNVIYVADVDAYFSLRLYNPMPGIYGPTWDQILATIQDTLEQLKSQEPSPEELEEWRLHGDVNMDGIVNEEDLNLINAAWQSRPGSPNWNPACDLNGDGVVDIQDMAIASKHYGRNYLVERENAWVDYPLTIADGPGTKGARLCKEVTFTCYGSPFLIWILLIIGLGMIVGGSVWLGMNVQSGIDARLFKEIHLQLEDALTRLDNLRQGVLEDPDIPQSSKDRIVGEIDEIVTAVSEASEKARKAGENPGINWWDWFWKAAVPILIPIVVVLVGVTVAISLLGKLIDVLTRRRS